MKLQRYTFEDALIKWGADKGKKQKTAVGVGLMLCSQLNWNKGGVLRWRTADACRATGITRSTFYKAMPILVEAGFYYLDNQQNYRVSLPETLEVSPTETHSPVETEVSPTETKVSPQQHPFSEVYLFSETNDLGWIKENAIEGIQHLFPLDALVPFSLTTNARDEHKEKPNYPEPPSGLQKHFDRQARINADILSEFGRAG